MKSEFKMCRHKNQWIIPAAYSKPLISFYNFISPIRGLKGRLRSFLENTCTVIRNSFYIRGFFFLRQELINCRFLHYWTWILTLFGLMRNTHTSSISMIKKLLDVEMLTSIFCSSCLLCIWHDEHQIPRCT